MKGITNYFNRLVGDMFHVMFPDLCIACRKQPKTQHAIFCVHCMHKMPYTDHFTYEINTVTKHFWGRIPLHHGAALLSFRDGSIVSTMIHGLKYKNRNETGVVLGEVAGNKMVQSSLFGSPDYIVPVPLTPKKKAKRGYNQSALFGQGVSTVTGIQMIEDILLKVTDTESQTGKTRTGRVENVSKTFSVQKADLIQGRHILVVDDVVTTGATVEACCIKLLDAGAAKISLLTIAAAE